ncbi:Uncharacterised protein [Yersinia mollaretii]|uniref:hypothetical protein n=1 Tax=Yersinia mollaretii TaxID=33060 RepID=UPI0005E8D8C1|nr:hypothetical protein [Yersinia mollaretii]CNK69214.1 Uncharacterised protein [Yersinia mollaretii]
MKELDSFTVERLEKISTSAFYYAGAEMEEIQALARIALAAKRAEPVGYVAPEALEYKNFYDVIMIENASGRRTMPLYGTPQLNSPEIPEGWKLVPNMPTLGMLSVLGLTGSFESMQQRYADMLYAAPEKPL